MMPFRQIALALVIPLGLDLFMPTPESNPITPEKVELGRRLFFDRRLSADGSISCATCHSPDHAFSDSRPVSAGVFGRSGRRNAPAIINRGYGRAFFWDGRSATLEEQVLKPIEEEAEMGSTVESAAARVGVSREVLSSALASFVRSILDANSPFDRFAAGDRTALTEDEQAGLKVFRGKGNCTACHVGPTFTDESFHNTGVAARDRGFSDNGRFDISGRPADRGAFKTPTLREVARTAPYMHDGSIRTLEDVIDFYDRGGKPNTNLDAEIRPLHLTSDEKRALGAFLRSLSGVLTEGLASLGQRHSSPSRWIR